MSKTISINVPSLTRVEGEGALQLDIQQGVITNLKLNIYEPPRYFEKFLEGRSYNQVIDSVARICGICPVAYQMSAVTAIEDCFGLKVSEWIQRMRQVMYCGEWIESHSLHIHLLALPDYYGYDSAIAMAKDYPEIITRGMRLQSIANRLIAVFGKRSVHPVGACVGGFYFAPKSNEINTIVDELGQGIELAHELLDFVFTMQLPKANRAEPLINVALCDDKSYPVLWGDITAGPGFKCNAPDFEKHFSEFQVPHSTAKQCFFHEQAYLVGPLARLNINHQHLSLALIKKLKKLTLPSTNLFESIIARAIEIIHSFELAYKLLEDYQSTEHFCERVKPKAGTGYGATEAPRGLLWHRYQMDDDGRVVECDIIPPTSQNQAHIEEDLRESLTQYGLDKPVSEIRLHAEMVIRNYDPCISCSTHFLNLTINEH